MVGTRVAAHLHHDDVDETTVHLSIMESVKVKFGFETETWISHVVGNEQTSNLNITIKLFALLFYSR